MFYKILMWASICWIAPLMGYLLINNAKFKKNIAVGVTFMEEGKRDADVISRLNKYKKQVKILNYSGNFYIKTLDIAYLLACVDRPCCFPICNTFLSLQQRLKKD